MNKMENDKLLTGLIILAIVYFVFMDWLRWWEDTEDMEMVLEQQLLKHCQKLWEWKESKRLWDTIYFRC